MPTPLPPHKNPPASSTSNKSLLKTFKLNPVYPILLIYTAYLLVLLLPRWLFAGYLGDFTLTISRYVGLELWSSLLFLFCNIAITVLLVLAMLRTGCRNFLWWSCGVVAMLGLLGLSLCPHGVVGHSDYLALFGLPGSAVADVNNLHQWFASITFTALALMGLITFLLSRRRPNWPALIFTIYAIIYIICYVNHLPFFTQIEFIWESLYFYLFFISLSFAVKNPRLEVK